MIREALATLIAGGNLSRVDASSVMKEILEGEATPSQIAALAIALRVKGETVQEISGFVSAMRGAATPVPLPSEIDRNELLDTCGTGGDGAQTFNVSTAVAFVAAGAGAQVAKHGNRAVSSRSGSADVLEELGVHIDLSPEQCAACLLEVGMVFLFAPAYHGALRHAAIPRKEMGVRTFFNILGPLCNPANAGRQLIGVFDPAWSRKMIEVLQGLGSRCVCIVHSNDGLDEVSIFAPSQLTWLEVGGEIREEKFDPDDHDLGHDDPAKVSGGDAAENAEMIRGVLAGNRGAASDFVIANAGVALVVAGLAKDISEGVRLARETIASGRAREKLDALVEFGRRAASEPSSGGTSG